MFLYSVLGFEELVNACIGCRAGYPHELMFKSTISLPALSASHYLLEIDCRWIEDIAMV